MLFRSEKLPEPEDGLMPDGAVIIAAITSCTNTSNPRNMVAAGIVARNAVEKGLIRKPWVKSSLAPGSKAVKLYLEEANLLPELQKLGFDVVAFERRGVPRPSNIEQGRVDIYDVRRVFEYRTFVRYTVRPADDERSRDSSFVRVVLEQTERRVVHVRPGNIDTCERVGWSRIDSGRVKIGRAHV